MKKGKRIKAPWDHNLPEIADTEALERQIKQAPDNKTWKRYRYCKEMADFWLEQAGHAYTNNPVEGLRAKGGFWSKKIFGWKDMAYIVGHAAQISPSLSKKLSKDIN